MIGSSVYYFNFFSGDVLHHYVAWGSQLWGSFFIFHSYLFMYLLCTIDMVQTKMIQRLCMVCARRYV